MKSGWSTKRLGDVCEFEKVQGIHSRLPYVGLEDIESHTAHFVGSSMPRAAQSSTFRFSPEHVLYGRLRPYLNKALAPDFEGHCSTEIFPLKPASNLSRGYLLYWLLADETVKKIDATCTGARMPRANMNMVMEFDFPLPPLREQQRIVGILNEAFSAIAVASINAETNMINSRELFESHLQSVFATRDGHWAEKRLGDVCELFQGLCINAKTKHLLVEKSDLPLLRIKDLRNNSAEQYIAESGWPKNSRVNESEIIYTRTGQIGLVFRGRSGILHNNCFKIRPSDQLNAEYLFWWLQNPTFKKRIVMLASKAAQPDISHSLFKSQIIQVPPRTYQDGAINLIDQMAENVQVLEKVYRHKLRALKELKKSLLHQAFTGQLTAA